MKKPFRLLLRALQVLVAVTIPLASAQVAEAATFTVTNNTDGSPDTACDVAGTGDGCNLREAIAAANADTTTADVITFAANVRGTIDLTRIGDNGNGASAFALLGPVDIQGPGADVLNVRRMSGGDYRILRVTEGVPAGVSGLTISGGNSPGSGGAIYNDRGSLTLSACAISGNVAAAFGGGIYSGLGNLTVRSCTISGNTQRQWRRH